MGQEKPGGRGGKDQDQEDEGEDEEDYATQEDQGETENDEDAEQGGQGEYDGQDGDEDYDEWAEREPASRFAEVPGFGRELVWDEDAQFPQFRYDAWRLAKEYDGRQLV